MRRFIYWLRRKWRIQEKRCGQCCLICPYYEECSGDYKKEKKAKIIQKYFHTKDKILLLKIQILKIKINL